MHEVIFLNKYNLKGKTSRFKNLKFQTDRKKFEEFQTGQMFTAQT